VKEILDTAVGASPLESKVRFLCANHASSLECDGERGRNPLQTHVISCLCWIWSRW